MPPRSRTNRFRIAIIGGGLGGLALAIGLQRKGVAFHVYEAAAKFTEVGAGVVFGPNAIKALGLIHPALLSAYTRYADMNPPGTWLTYRFGMDLRNKAHGQGEKGPGEPTGKAGQVFWTQHDRSESGYIHRARLLDEMAKLVPREATSFGKKLVRIEEQPNDELMLFFADGTTVTADAVVGCDGIKSNTREFVCGKSVQPTYSGSYIYQQMLPIDAAVTALGQERAKSMTMECGYGSYIVHFALDNATLMNLTAIVQDPKAEWAEESWLAPVSHDAMVQEWKDWDDPIVHLMSRFGIPERRAIFDLIHDFPYARDRVCLLGDSAHASTPHNGAGASMAMEDAYVLSGLLAETHRVQDVCSAFKAYSSVRRHRTQELVERGRISGLIESFMCPGLGDDPDKIKTHLESTYAWIWDFDLKEHFIKARRIMNDYRVKL